MSAKKSRKGRKTLFAIDQLIDRFAEEDNLRKSKFRTLRTLWLLFLALLGLVCLFAYQMEFSSAILGDLALTAGYYAEYALTWAPPELTEAELIWKGAEVLLLLLVFLPSLPAYLITRKIYN